MELNLATFISVAAILVILFCLYSVIALGRSIPGGVVGKQWRFLTFLVAMFTVGYLLTPFFGMLPPQLITIIVSVIFFFGAIYVLITIRLIHRIITELTE